MDFYLMHKEYILHISIKISISLGIFSSQQTVKVLFQLLAGLQRWLHFPGHLIFSSQRPQFCSLPFVDIPHSGDTDSCGG